MNDDKQKTEIDYIPFYCNWRTTDIQYKQLLSHAKELVKLIRRRHKKFFIDLFSFEDMTFIEAIEDDEFYRISFCTFDSEYVKVEDIHAMPEPVRRKYMTDRSPVLELQFRKNDDKQLVEYSLHRYNDIILFHCEWQDIVDYLKCKFTIDQLHFGTREGGKLIEIADIYWDIQQKLDTYKMLEDVCRSRDEFLKGKRTKVDKRFQAEDDTRAKYYKMLLEMRGLIYDYQRVIK